MWKGITLGGGPLWVTPLSLLWCRVHVLSCKTHKKHWMIETILHKKERKIISWEKDTCWWMLMVFWTSLCFSARSAVIGSLLPFWFQQVLVQNNDYGAHVRFYSSLLLLPPVVLDWLVRFVGFIKADRNSAILLMDIALESPFFQRA